MKNEDLTALIKTRFPEAIMGENIFGNELTLTVQKDSVAEVARFLKENEGLDFNFLSDLCGVDRVETDNVFEVVYHLYSLSNNHRLRLKAPVPSDSPLSANGNRCLEDSKLARKRDLRYVWHYV